jgi:hypothetical protein
MKKIGHSNSERDNKIKHAAGRCLAMAAIAIGALSLFLSSTNNGIPIASAQFVIPDEDSATTTSPSPSPPETTTGGTGDNFLLRGFVGSMISAGDEEDDNETGLGNYVLAGRWRLVVNESEAQRFVANFSMGTTNGSDLHNVFIENLPGTSESNTTDGGARSYSLRADLLIDNTETIGAVPITVTMNGDVLSVDVDTDEEVSSNGNDTFRTIRGQTIYGIVDR